MASSRKAEGREVVLHLIELSSFCHATEDCEKVRAAILNLIHPELRGKVVFMEEVLQGYYGNKILVLKTEIPEEVEKIVNYLASAMSNSEKAVLKATLPLRFDPRSKRLILRFSKQDAFLGSIRLLDSDDVVKMTLHFKGARSIEKLSKYLAQAGLIP